MPPFEHTDFARAFRPAEVFHCPDRGRIMVRSLRVAQLVLPSGRIITCDPCFLQSVSDFPPFRRAVAPGQYPVFLSLATIRYRNRTEQRIACAMVRFTRTKVRRWEMALREGDDPDELRPDRIFGYWVDSGQGCFLDVMASENLEPERRLYGHRSQQLWAKGGLIDLDAIRQLTTPFFQRLEAETIEAGREWADLVIDPETGSNLVVFYSGYGDGTYASYWGLDSRGEVACLATDFDILTIALKATVKFPLEGRRAQVLSHPDLEEMGLQNIKVVRSRNGRKIRLEQEGEYCSLEFQFETGRKRQWRGESRHQGNVSEYTFDEPLPANVRLVIHYCQGVRAL